MIRGLNKMVDLSGLGYMMSTYASHSGGPKQAADDAGKAAAELLLSGLTVISPIVHSHAIEEHLVRHAYLTSGDMDYFRSHEFWMPIDERIFERCDYGIVAMTKGWCWSTGIAMEIRGLAQRGIPIYFLDLEEYAVYTLDEMRGGKWAEEFGDLVTKAITDGYKGYMPSTADAQIAALDDIMTDVEAEVSNPTVN